MCLSYLAKGGGRRRAGRLSDPPPPRPTNAEGKGGRRSFQPHPPPPRPALSPPHIVGVAAGKKKAGSGGGGGGGGEGGGGWEVSRAKEKDGEGGGGGDVAWHWTPGKAADLGIGAGFRGLGNDDGDDDDLNGEEGPTILEKRLLKRGIKGGGGIGERGSTTLGWGVGEAGARGSETERGRGRPPQYHCVSESPSGKSVLDSFARERLGGGAGGGVASGRRG